MIIINAAGTVGAPSITDPSELADIWEWWEPSRESFSDNDPIAQLTGQVAPGSGHNWTQSSAGLKPTYKASIINGHGVARFDGTDDEMQDVNPTALTAVHLLAVIKIDNDPPAAGKSGLWSFGSGAASEYPSSVPTNIGETAFRTASFSFSKSGISLAAWRVIEIVSTSSEWNFKLDGTQIGSTTASFGHQSSGFIRLGRSSPFESNWLDGDLAGLYLMSAKLSAGNRTAMINYLNSRFGLSAS